MLNLPKKKQKTILRAVLVNDFSRLQAPQRDPKRLFEIGIWLNGLEAHSIEAIFGAFSPGVRRQLGTQTLLGLGSFDLIKQKGQQHAVGLKFLASTWARTITAMN